MASGREWRERRRRELRWWSEWREVRRWSERWRRRERRRRKRLTDGPFVQSFPIAVEVEREI